MSMDQLPAWLPAVGQGISSLHTEAFVASGQVMMRLDGVHKLTVSIGHSYFDEHSSTQIAQDISRCGRLLSSRRAGELKDLQASTRTGLIAGSRLEKQVNEFDHAVAESPLLVRSPDGMVAIEACGSLEFVVTLAEDLKQRFSAGSFAATLEVLGLQAIHARVASVMRVRMEAAAWEA